MFNKLAGLSTRTKLLAILVSLLVPVAMLFYVDTSRSMATIHDARAEDIGNAWARPLVDMVRNLADHRDSAARVLAGHDDERAGMQQSQALVEQSARALDELERTDAGGLAQVVGWSALRPEVMRVVAADVKTPQLFDAHNDAVAKLLAVIRVVAARSGLALDSGVDTFALMNSTILQLPSGLDALARVRRQFEAISGGDNSAATRSSMGEHLGLAQARLEVVFDDLTNSYAVAAPNDKAIIEPAVAADKEFAALLPQLRAAGAGIQLPASQIADMAHRTEQLSASLGDIHDKAAVTLDRLLKKRVATAEWNLYAHVAIVLLSLALALAIVLWVTRYLGSQVGKANKVFTNMAEGRFDSVIGAQPGDELGVLLGSLDRMQLDLRTRLEAERVVAQTNSRIRQSLDASSASVMVADEKHHIIYMNRAAEGLMQVSQEDFRRALSGFDTAKLVGSNIEALQGIGGERASYASLSAKLTTEQKFGGKTMRITASPIIDDGGVRLGTVVEWTDRTQELAVESEVQHIVTAAIDGNLDERLVLEGKTGFFRSLSGGLNEWVDNVSSVVAEVQTLVAAVNDGNLARRIRTEGKSGLMVKMGSGINDLTSNIATVVDQVQGLVSAANDGDLTRRIPLDGQSGLLIKVGTGINELTDGMAKIVSQVKLAAGEVTRGAEEISQGNANLSQRTEEQASSLEETASSMEEMTSTVKQNAENAGQANQLALAAREQAEKGGTVVSKAVKAMTEINDASSKIANIIGVIDEIAFQTNLLALNAAVEAARAGEQGRGFAVVATEVRNLAGRSATAAKEIKALIQNSVLKVEEGSNLVTQSGATLEQIVGAVKKVTDIVAEIAAASQEQSAGIEQVNKAVMQLDELTQQNAALVEEASAASQSMAEQARSLNDSMQRYQVDEAQLADMLLQRPALTRPVVQAVQRKPVRSRVAPAKSAFTARAKANGADDAVWKEF